MANQKISALTALATPSADDLLPIVDDPGGSPVTKNVTFANLMKSAVAGVDASYKLARVAIPLDGSNPTPWATGLATIVACGGSLQGTAAPGVGTSILTFDISTTTVNIYAWKVTATGDCTLIASTGTETVYAWAIGT